MMKMKTNTTGLSRMNSDGGIGGDGEWEIRPGGMMVQKRTGTDQNNGAVVPMIRVRVKFQSIYHQLNISSQATFGELKKMLSGPTGLHHEDQKLLFKNKERDSKTFLDIVGVKDRSKIVLIEDPICQEKRYIEMIKIAKMEKASKSISEISLAVDRLARQVSKLEAIISRGGKVVEKDVLSLTELLMNQLLKLDGIVGDGDVKLQRKLQVQRVQKFVETLDLLKIKNSMPASNGTAPKNDAQIQQQQTTPRYANGKIISQNQETNSQQDKPTGHSPSGSVIITTQWETFDVGPSVGPVPPQTSTVHPKFNWDLL